MPFSRSVYPPQHHSLARKKKKIFRRGLSLDKGDTVRLSVFANYNPEQNTFELTQGECENFVEFVDL